MVAEIVGTVQEDHPRACGENRCRIQPPPLSLGSPPRMRGKLHPRLTVSEPTGITPAHAGKTSRLHTSLPTRRDHPRACGENAIMSAVCVQSTGSSPRVRGKLQPVPCSELRVGITPACAGKTAARRDLLPSSRDHPRVCGENLGESYEEFVEKGSPPRVRGKHARYRAPDCPCGITPACAGKTGASYAMRLIE